jgi:hypothetical protein
MAALLFGLLRNIAAACHDGMSLYGRAGLRI